MSDISLLDEQYKLMRMYCLSLIDAYFYPKSSFMGKKAIGCLTKFVVFLVSEPLIVR